MSEKAKDEAELPGLEHTKPEEVQKKTVTAAELRPKDRPKDPEVARLQDQVYRELDELRGVVSYYGLVLQRNQEIQTRILRALEVARQERLSAVIGPGGRRRR